eukprot:CAMPEP_0172366470 /NCGR_PEP_ID=MMETSP1060-20121228/15467_1 /TAXON_ID=37318 /ORGANISM="Pseudo-nitzschia pungens, Strain cf. cingulata" /LENGTH=114 /DNA_ID=CAMNT_0013090339 /DNA_START=253 /DNA_END=597 /DNA_ORIENTATION=+
MAPAAAGSFRFMLLGSLLLDPTLEIGDAEDFVDAFSILSDCLAGLVPCSESCLIVSLDIPSSAASKASENQWPDVPPLFRWSFRVAPRSMLKLKVQKRAKQAAIARRNPTRPFV